MSIGPNSRAMDILGYRASVFAMIAGAAIFSSPLSAQSTSEAASEEETGNEIVVTAQRRAMSSDDVAATLSVLGGSELEDRNISTMSEAIAVVPNVDIKENAPGALPVVTIRGVGLNDFGANTSPSAGIYVDEVYLPSVIMMNSQIYDLARVEVLKGPQGTLYGRNSTAGAINFISAAPVFRDEGHFSVGYGNYDTAEVEGVFNTPLSESMALRVSSRVVQQQDGFWKSRQLPGSIGKQSIQTGRVQLLFHPSAGFESWLKVEGLRHRGEIGVPEFFGAINPLTFGFCDSILAGRSDDTSCTNFFGYTDTDRDPFIVDTDRKGFLRNSGWDITWKNDVDVGFAELTSVTAYRRFSQAFDTNIDATPLPILDFITTGRVKAFSQELRLAGVSGPIDWVVGGNYSWDNFLGSSAGSNQALFNTDLFITVDQTTRAKALFAHTIFELTPALSAIAGIRYTSEKRSYAGGSFDLNPYPGGSVLCGGCIVPFTIAETDDSISDSNVTGTVGLNFQPNPDTLLYATVARGQKSGGFYFGLSTDPVQLEPYLPEKLTSYEVGAKLTLSGGLMQLNSSAFYYDYRDIQTFIRSNAGFIPVQVLSNVDKATVKGIDFDATFRPAQGLRLQAAVGLLDSRLGEYVSGTGVTQVENRLPNAPKFSFRGVVGYETRATDRGLQFKASAQAAYNSKQFRDADNNPLLVTPSYWVVDANAGVVIDGSIELSAWVRNLFDERYVLQAIDLTALGFGNRNYGNPRTIGVRASFSW